MRLRLGDILARHERSDREGVRVSSPARRENAGHDIHIMLETIAIVLLLLWVLGFVSSYTMGGFIHILLVLAIISLLIRVIRGRPAD